LCYRRFDIAERVLTGFTMVAAAAAVVYHVEPRWLTSPAARLAMKVVLLVASGGFLFGVT